LLKRQRWILFTGAGAALAIRVSHLLAHRGNFDTGVYERIVALFRSGGNLYSGTNEYKWSPVWALLLWVIHGVGGALGWPLHRAVGFFLLGVDGVTAYLVYRIALRIGSRGESGALGAAVLFFANPVSIFASGFNLQWDNLSILFLLAALLFALPPEGRKTRFVASLSASILIKHISWCHPILLFQNRTLPGRWRRARRRRRACRRGAREPPAHVRGCRSVRRADLSRARRRPVRRSYREGRIVLSPAVLSG